MFSQPTVNKEIADSPFARMVKLNGSATVDTGFYVDVILRSLTAIKYDACTF